MTEVYIQSGFRTPIGLYQGQYKDILPEILAQWVLDDLHDVWGQTPDCVFVGNAVGPGGNLGRLALLYSSLPDSVPAVTMDMQCASGMIAIETAYAHIKAGIVSSAFAGGVDSSSMQPVRTYVKQDPRSQLNLGEDLPGQFKVAQFSPGLQDCQVMLWGAERTAQKYGMRRDELDAYALESHRKALHARKERILEPYLSHGHAYVDQSLRPHMSERLLARMPCLLGTHTVTTAGNACLTHDGAAFLALSTEKSDMRIIGFMPWAGNPDYSPEGAWKSTESLLRSLHMTIDDIDVIEWNEAFACIDGLFYRRYPKAVKRFNPLGGALAYGHPYGCSGAMLVIHAMASLRHRGGRYALCAIAGAGGTGTAIMIEHD